VVARRVVIVGGALPAWSSADGGAARAQSDLVGERSTGRRADLDGGRFAPAQAVCPHRRFYERQAQKGLFEVRLQTIATPEAVLALSPDAVVIATGSRPNRVELPGAESSASLYTVHEAIAGEWMTLGIRPCRSGGILPSAGRRRLSFGTGIQVDFVTPLLRVSPTVESMMLDEMLEQLQARGVRFWPGLEAVEWVAAARYCCAMFRPERNKRL